MTTRIIARLDIKGENLIKGIHLEGLRVIGNPNEYAKKYYLQGADEIIYMDSVASLYGRNNLTDIVTQAAKNIFIPMTVGGGIKTIDDAQKILRAGADKIAINTAAVNNKNFISELAQKFGKQCVVLSVEAKKQNNSWESYTENGRERTGLDVIEWVKEAETLGAGEILLTSVDQEGTGKGLDIDLINKVRDAVNIPLIASGGLGTTEDAVNLHKNCKIAAIASAYFLHYNHGTIKDIKQELSKENFPVRHVK